MKTVRFFLLFLTLCSCSQNKVTNDLIIIHIDPSKVEDAYDISNDVEEEWEIFALETTDDCVVNQISNIIYQNNIYYILDKKGNTVFLFDSIGNYISKLYKKGQGPDEYYEIEALCLENKNIWISDGNLRNMICYDENLKMVERFSTFDVIGVYHMKYINGNIYMATNWSGWNIKNMQLAASIDEYSNPVIIKFKLKQDSKL
jgi:hypothetical protein